MGKILRGQATAYGPPWNAMEGTGITSTGVNLQQGKQKLVVAVDPGVIPYGTKLKIWPNPFGDPDLIFTASDTGGAFNGSGKANVDFFVASGRKDQNKFGRRGVKIQIVGKGKPKDVAILGEGQEMGPVKNVKANTGTEVGGMTGGSPESTLGKVISSFAAATKPPGAEENPFGDPTEKIRSMTDQLLAMKSQASSPTPTASSPSPLSSPAGGTIEGGPSGHVQPGSPESAALLKAIARKAEKMGLHVGEFGNAAPGVHTDTSYHYRKVDGVGRGMDVSGDPDKMKNFSVLLEKLYGGSLSELFYNGPGGRNRKNGKRVPRGFVPKHTDHVHVAV